MHNSSVAQVMSQMLTPPETPADAILMVHALIDESVVPHLAHQFGDTALATTHSNALAWMVLRVAESISAPFYGNFGREIDFDKRVDETLPGGWESAVNELPPSTEHPKPFDYAQSTIILAAMRRMVHRPDHAEYLTRLTQQRPLQAVREPIVRPTLVPAVAI